jgi:hypothetical protein
MDPLLVIVSGRHPPLSCLQAFAAPGEQGSLATELRGATLVARRLAGREDVIATHPPGPDTPAAIDFSAITASGRGVLHLAMRGHERGVCAVVLRRAGRDLERIAMRHGAWIERELPFDREPVVVVHEAEGWVNAFLALTYRVDDRRTGAASTP